MNYYEELAVAVDASLEEIHQAYRALARVLHPDNQSEPGLKSAAERQMIRLNEILATLADPEKRRKYDESLCQKLAVREAFPPPPPPPRSARMLHRYGPWILACCILAGAGLWYLGSNEGGERTADRGSAPLPERAVQRTQTAARESTPPASESRLPKTPLVRPKPSPPPQDLQREYSAPSERGRQLLEPREPAVAVPGDAREKVAPPVAPPQASREEPALSQRTARQPAGPAFAGHWFYIVGAHDQQTPGMYPPDFIELFLSEEKGELSGRYWARYRIADKPVSPEVQFHVSGAPDKGNTTILKWESADGAKGRMKMVLGDSNSMEVSWWTTAFGEQTALTSGTAVLVRQTAR